MTTTSRTEVPDTHNAIIGTSMVVLAAFGFSSKAILIKLAYDYQPGLEPITLMALRMSFALPLFLAVAHWNRGQRPPVTPERRDWLSLLVVGLLGYYLASLLDFSGLQYISAGLERLIGFRFLAPDIYFISDFPSQVRPAEVAQVAGIAVLLAFVSTIYPAWRGAVAAPADALRHE
jgi:hypothetical protein